MVPRNVSFPHCWWDICSVFTLVRPYLWLLFCIARVWLVWGQIYYCCLVIFVTSSSCEVFCTPGIRWKGPVWKEKSIVLCTVRNSCTASGHKKDFFTTEMWNVCLWSCIRIFYPIAQISQRMERCHVWSTPRSSAIMLSMHSILASLKALPKRAARGFDINACTWVPVTSLRLGGTSHCLKRAHKPLENWRVSKQAGHILQLLYFFHIWNPF